MEIQEATTILSRLGEAMRSVRWELSAKNTEINQLKKDTEKLKELKEENKRLKQVERHYEIISKHSFVAICPDCNGEGGHTWEGPEGADGRECSTCNGNGVVPKGTATK